jgi:hypothetical protein
MDLFDLAQKAESVIVDVFEVDTFDAAPTMPVVMADVGVMGIIVS